MSKDVTIGLVVPFAEDKVPPEGLQMYPGTKFVPRGVGVRSLTPEGFAAAFDAIPAAADDLARKGVDAIMVGRASLGDPWLIREIAAAMRGEAMPAPPAVDEVLPPQAVSASSTPVAAMPNFPNLIRSPPIARYRPEASWAHHRHGVEQALANDQALAQYRIGNRGCQTCPCLRVGGVLPHGVVAPTKRAGLLVQQPHGRRGRPFAGRVRPARTQPSSGPPAERASAPAASCSAPGC